MPLKTVTISTPAPQLRLRKCSQEYSHSGSALPNLWYTNTLHWPFISSGLRRGPQSYHDKDHCCLHVLPSSNSTINNEFKVIHRNANGITWKKTEFLTFINKTRADIVLFSETKFNPKQLLKLQNYITYRSDNVFRSGKASYSGTAVLVHRRIVHHHIILNTSIKLTSIEIFLGTVFVRISVVYNHLTKS